MVSLSAARVHDEAEKPANIIRAIPIDSYDSEVGISQRYNSKMDFVIYLNGVYFAFSFLTTRQIASWNKL